MSEPVPEKLSYAHGTGDTALLGDTIGRNLDRTVAVHGDREALVDVASGRRWTYTEFAADVDVLARALMASGVAKGDRVGIWAVNCPEWVLVQYATARIGAVMVTINPAYRAHEVEFVLQQAGVSLLVASLSHRTSDYRTLVEEVRGNCPGLRAVHYIGDPSWAELTAAAPAVTRGQLAAREAELSCDDPINIQYTSGTTGFPKGATLSHHNILNNGYFVGETIAYSEADRVCLPVPFYHCFKWYRFWEHASGRLPPPRAGASSFTGREYPGWEGWCTCRTNSQTTSVDTGRRRGGARKNSRIRPRCLSGRSARSSRATTGCGWKPSTCSPGPSA
ncbi:AMP-binding protein [Streptomyces griseus]|uniref:AMP-binding protein n=1 Tax=Streptomyces griseus TaxID=1911 RepID=UPI003869C1BD